MPATRTTIERPTRYDRAEIIRAVNAMTAIGSGGVTELRALAATIAGERRSGTYAGYFDNAEALVSEVGKLTSWEGVYIIPNSVDLRLLARAKNRIRLCGKDESTPDKHITERRYLLIDCDAIRPTKIAATDREHEAAMARARMVCGDLFEEGWPDPIYADSGNGGHLIYAIEGVEPQDDQLISQCLEALQTEYGDEVIKLDTSVYNASRIWKLPGTLACKGDCTDDRPHRMAQIVNLPDDFGGAKVTREQLEALAANAPQPKAAPATKRHEGNGHHSGGFDLEWFIANYLPDAIGPEPYQGGQRWQLPVCPFNPEHSRREAWIIRRADGPIQAGCRHESCKWKWHDLRAKYEPKQERSTQKPRHEQGHDDAAIFVHAPQSIGELRRAHPRLRPPVIDGVLRRAETMNIIAPPKSKKSFLALGLGVTAVVGGAWLGLYPVEKGDVLILDNELHAQTTPNRATRVTEAMGVALADVDDHLFVEHMRGRNAHVFSLASYFADIKPGRYRFIILDALYRFWPPDCDENDNADVTAVYNAIDAYAERLGAAFILVHHQSKGSQSSKAVTDVGAGAGAIARAADTHLILRQHEVEGAYVLDAALRSWPPIDPRCLRFKFPIWEPDDSLDPAALKPDKPRRQRVEPPASEEPPKPPWTPERFADAFVTDDPKTIAEIITAATATTEISRKSAETLLAAAEGLGLAQRWGRGNQKRRISRLPEPQLELVE